MNISIVGTGYVGLVNATCFAELGVNVTCVDRNSQKINRLIYGAIPIYEPGLESLVTRNMNDKRLNFSNDFSKGFIGQDYVFCAVDSAADDDGATDISPILDIARAFGTFITGYSVFVLKSTVPVGTAQRVKEEIAVTLAGRKSDIPYDVVSNPDFLTEGNGIKDFMRPDRIVVGYDTDSGRAAMDRLYHNILLQNNSHMIYTDMRTAEMIKYAATSMLATRVSFMNEIANLCELVDADVNTVRHGVGTDSRIGPKYIFPGCGYGGTLFPQDIKDLIKIANEKDFDMKVLKAVEAVNVNQKRILVDKLLKYYGGDIKDKTIALWGLSFKPETDDMSASPAIDTLNLLTEAGCRIRVFDPVAMNAAKRRWENIYCSIDMYDAVKGADALLLITEWQQFRIPAWDRVKALMNTPLVIDGRNIYDAHDVEATGLIYHCVGR